MDWSALQLDAAAKTPLYLQLCTTLTGSIAAGLLQPGDQLPSERKLAELLSISRTTAVNAYHELEARGLGAATWAGVPSSVVARNVWARISRGAAR